MRKLFSFLLLTFFIGNVAFAQDDTNTIDIDPQANLYGSTQWVGIGLGYPSFIHYGISDVFGNADLHLRLSSRYFDTAIGAETLFDLLRIEDLPVNVYAGGGLDVRSLGSRFGIGINGVAGAEYRFSENLGFFLELNALIPFYFGDPYTYGFRDYGGSTIGVKYHF